MKFKRFKHLALPILLVTLTSCGYGLREYYEGNVYISPIFAENYYRFWDKRIDDKNEKNQITGSHEYLLDEELDLVFTAYEDDNFALVDPSSASELDYAKDYSIYDKDAYLGTGYGQTKKISRIEDSFKNGYVSKLFDGQMFCHGRYQEARVQIDEGGFGSIFKRESDNLDYFALSFKASYDYTRAGEYDFIDERKQDEHGNPIHCNNVPNNLNSGVTLKVSFYEKNDKGFEKHTFKYKIDMTTQTNPTESPGSSKCYIFFGFSFRNYELKRVNGFSISYDFDRTNKQDNPMRDLKDFDGNSITLDYSLMLYEAFLPNTTWH